MEKKLRATLPMPNLRLLLDEANKLGINKTSFVQIVKLDNEYVMIYYGV